MVSNDLERSGAAPSGPGRSGRRRARLLRVLLSLLALAALGGGAAAAALYLAFLRDLPDIRSVEDYRPPLASVVVDRSGRRIGEFFTERRRLVPLSEVPQHVVRAFVAAEDSTFFEHGGIDYNSILRAAWKNLLAGGKVQGGSTITQQMVKGLLLTPERTIRRKVREAILAYRIEQRLTKQEILYLYLNQIYFGHGAYGIAEAARTYFDKPVSELNVAEAAQLAGLPKAPASYSPLRHPEEAERRRQYVLARMLKEHYVDQATYEQAAAAPPKLADANQAHDYEDAAYFTEEVRRYLFDTLGGDTVLEGGLFIETSLDMRLQHAAVSALRSGLHELDQRQGYRGPLRKVAAADIAAERARLAEQNDLAAPEAPAPVGAAPGAGGADADDADDDARRAARDALQARLAEEPLLAVVTAVDDEAQRAVVAFSPQTSAIVALEDVRWARRADPDHRGVPVKRIDQVFAVGDVARFAPAGPGAQAQPPAQGDASGADAAPLRVRLVQEPLVQGGLLSLALDTGDVIALVGGYDYAASQFDRVTQARRQPGSAFKPLVYGAAMSLTDEHGSHRFTPASIIYDRPKVYTDHATGFIWKPKNYGREFYGPITMRKALAKSINTAAVHLCDEVGVGNVIRYARRLGIESPLEPSLALALGTSGVSLLELTRAYAVFPAGGRRVVPRFIHRVRDRDGNVLLENVALGNDFGEEVPSPDPPDVASGPAALAPGRPAPLEPEQLIPPEDAYLMTDMLRAVVLEGTGQRVKHLGRPLGGKTGTTNDQADAWFVGFSPEIATGVWVGHDEIRFLGPGETGSRAAAPIWIDYMDAALEGLPKRDFPAPASIVFARIDRETGLLASNHSRDTVFQAFVAGTEPTETADMRRTTDEALRNLREDALSGDTPSDDPLRLMRLDDF